LPIDKFRSEKKGDMVVEGILLFSVALQPQSGLGRLGFEVYRPHTQTHTPGRTPLDE
jgi:hypothetical protein